MKQEIKKTIPNTPELISYLASINEKVPNQPTSLSNLIKRPAFDLVKANKKIKAVKGFPKAVLQAVETDIKYAGYIGMQHEQIEKDKKLEEKKIPADFDFNSLAGFRLEAREKLSKIKPLTVGMASRISGVNPADITVLLMYLK